MTVRLEAIRHCMEGAVPSTIATCTPEGIPNISYLCQVFYLDSRHVALSFQFFNKTHANILAHPWATAEVYDPLTAAKYCLSLKYLRTETEGPVFERMRAKLVGIASFTGMSHVFRLQGSDIYQVEGVECVVGNVAAPRVEKFDSLTSMRAVADRLRACNDLEQLMDAALLTMEVDFGYRHTMFLMMAATGDRLYTLASRGYADSGIGSEIALGEGIIGVAARERTPIRIAHLASEYLYSRSVRGRFLQANPEIQLETEIALPGLPDSRSQLAVPILYGEQLLGVVYAESVKDNCFTHEDEDALVLFADMLSLALARQQPKGKVQFPVGTAMSIPQAQLLEVRHYRYQDTLFVDGEYLIKGVAGAILWMLLNEWQTSGRCDFSNRELRLDSRLRLPEVGDNLEARLILLQRRLGERCPVIRLEKVGRGLFRLQIDTRLELVSVDEVTDSITK